MSTFNPALNSRPLPDPVYDCFYDFGKSEDPMKTEDLAAKPLLNAVNEGSTVGSLQGRAMRELTPKMATPAPHISALIPKKEVAITAADIQQQALKDRIVRAVIPWISDLVNITIAETEEALERQLWDSKNIEQMLSPFEEYKVTALEAELREGLKDLTPENLNLFCEIINLAHAKNAKTAGDWIGIIGSARKTEPIRSVLKNMPVFIDLQNLKDLSNVMGKEWVPLRTKLILANMDTDPF